MTGTDRGRPTSCSWEEYSYDLEKELDSAGDEIDDLKAQIKDLEQPLEDRNTRLLFPAEEEPKR